MLRGLCDGSGETGKVGKALVGDLVARFASLNLVLQMKKNRAVLLELLAIEVQLLDLGSVFVH